MLDDCCEEQETRSDGERRSERKDSEGRMPDEYNQFNILNS